jgi:hypothetical protein
VSPVQTEIHQLRAILEAAQAKVHFLKNFWVVYFWVFDVFHFLFLPFPESREVELKTNNIPFHNLEIFRGFPFFFSDDVDERKAMG